MQNSKQKGLLNYPRFHFQKLRVVKTHKKIYGSNNCWWFINSHPGDPHIIETVIWGTLPVPRNIALPAETVDPHITNIFSSTFPVVWILSHLYPMISTFPVVWILSHLYHSYKHLLLLPEFIFMDFHYFSFQLLWLLGENLKFTDVILRMLIRIVITKLSCNQ